MSSYTIDGLTYTDKLPHSRVEDILYRILDKQGENNNSQNNNNNDPNSNNNDPNNNG